MTGFAMQNFFQISPSRKEMAAAVAEVLVTRIHKCLAPKQQGEYVNIAVAGGFIGTEILPALLSHLTSVDWSRIRFWWVDERFVDARSLDRNDWPVIDSVLTFLPGVSWVSMPSDEGQGLDEAVAFLESQWHELMRGQAFDICLLGMGPDGHIASLFPGHAWNDSTQRDIPVRAVSDSPKPPRQRLTFSMQVIVSSHCVLLAAAGAEKAEALRHIRVDADTKQWPVAELVQPRVAHKLTVFIDADAAQALA